MRLSFYHALAGIALVPATSAVAQRDGWTVRLEPTWLTPRGHDQHVLTIHEITTNPAADTKTAVTLDTRSGFSYRAGLDYTRGHWTWGVTWFWFDNKQEVAPLAMSAAGAGSSTRFEIADQSFTSTGPGQVLFYRVLEDSELALWTIDVHAVRSLLRGDDSHLGLQLGIRFGDFDNDYRAVVGVENVNGTRLDASSNYGRMTGPLVGLIGGATTGRVTFDGYVGQSVMLGDAAVEVMARRFTGSADAPVYTEQELFSTPLDVAIPVTETRIRGTIQLTRGLAIGAGVTASMWWDVGVPPGIVPVPGGDQTLHENTLIFLGGMGVLEIRF